MQLRFICSEFYLIAFLPLSLYKNNNKAILKQLIMKENFVDIPIGLPKQKCRLCTFSNSNECHLIKNMISKRHQTYMFFFSSGKNTECTFPDWNSSFVDLAGEEDESRYTGPNTLQLLKASAPRTFSPPILRGPMHQVLCDLLDALVVPLTPSQLGKHEGGAVSYRITVTPCLVCALS